LYITIFRRTYNLQVLRGMQIRCLILCVCVCSVIKKVFVVLHTRTHICIHTRYMYIFNNFYVLCLKSTSDLTIEVKEQPIYVHKAVLKIRSLYFRTMFQSNYIENKQRYLQAKSTFLKIFLIFFLYFVTLQHFS